MKSLNEFLNEGKEEKDAESVLKQMLPILNKISQKDRMKMETYDDNEEFESPLVDIFHDMGIADNDDYYDEIQELVNDFLDDNDAFGKNAIKDVTKIKIKI